MAAIHVTKTFLPPQTRYGEILARAWDAGWITNRGALVKELETTLKSYLGVEYLIATTNGTLPLQIAIKALGLQGEIITTPFSYVATTSSIYWEQCTPVFVDIEPEYFTIDPAKIEASITPSTSAILATHVFGNPCDVDAIEAIATKHNLKVIYDAAHCFGVQYKGKSILNYGDVSTLSFHATKLFHTGEGGAMICNNQTLNDCLFYHHNFGHRGKEEFQCLGINAKMSELQAAMGLAVLDYIAGNIQKRAAHVEAYRFKLEGVKSIKIRPETEWNSAYFPILFKDSKSLSAAVDALNKEDIFPRRYFYPSLETLPYVNSNHCHVANKIASTVLCLPLYESLTPQELERICNIVNSHA